MVKMQKINLYLNKKITDKWTAKMINLKIYK
jgi:hypothetical protein